MKRLYLGVIGLLIFKQVACSFSHHCSYGKDSSHGSSSSYQQVKQEPKQEEKTSYKESFEYAQQQFSTYDTRSQQLAGETVDTLKTTKDPHEHAFNLGLYMALAITREAGCTPQLTPSILKASFSDPCLEQQQRDAIKIHCSRVSSSSDQNVEKTATVAQKVSNFFVSVIEGFKEQAKKVDLCNEVSGLESTTRAHQFPGVKHIKEMVSKFSQLSSEGKKTVGSLVLAGNMSDALKVISVGDKGVVYYRNTRQNDVEGANPRCRVEKSYVREGEPSFLSPDSFKFKEITYRFDCPRLPQSATHRRNDKCDYNPFTDTMTCPLNEHPFQLHKEIGIDTTITLLRIAELKSHYDITDWPNHLDKNFFFQEVTAAQKHLESFYMDGWRDYYFSKEALTHLYAQALLIGQDVFNIDVIPQKCVQEIVSRYGVSFTLPKDALWTNEDIKNECNAARKHLSSHVLFTDNSERINRLQCAEAVNMMHSIIEFTRESTTKTVGDGRSLDFFRDAF